MKKSILYSGILVLLLSIGITSCTSPIKMTGMKNVNIQSEVSKVVVMPLFEKIENVKPFEETMVTYFKGKGLAAIGSLEFLKPGVKYPINDIKHKCDSLGADAILIFNFEGLDKKENYTAPASYNADYYNSYGGYWGGGTWGTSYYTNGNVGIAVSGYGGGNDGTGGEYHTKITLHLSSKLFVKGSKDPLWTGQIELTNPQYLDEAAIQIGSSILADWKSSKILKSNPGK
jgi:hypothetical protein